MNSFGHNTTADEVAAAFPGAVRGKTILITGGNSGLGQETGRVLAAAGASVILACRSKKNGDEAVATLKATLGENADVSFIELDLGDQKQIKAAADAFLASGKPLHVLINNAGVMATPHGTTKDGFETQMGVNHLVRGLWRLRSRCAPLLLRDTSPCLLLALSFSLYCPCVRRATLHSRSTYCPP
jgi:retinol dehydrogenase-12